MNFRNLFPQNNLTPPDTAPAATAQKEPEREVPSAWETHVQQYLKSPDTELRKHLFLGLNIGVNEKTGKPQLLHRDILAHHAYMLGAPGSGKTTLGMAPLIMQLIRQRDWRKNPNGTIDENSPLHGSVVILDLKGDMALFETARREAEQMGRTFKFFTNKLQMATFAYNPFQGRSDESVSAHQVAQTILEALSLNHGEGYGRSFYSEMARDWLSDTLSKYDIQSFEDLQRKTPSVDGTRQEKEERENIAELVSTVQALASYPQLNVTAETKEHQAVHENAIFMPDVLKKKQVVYFWLPAGDETVTARKIAKLVIYDLFQRSKETRGAHQVYLFIDEFQMVVSEGLKLIVQQGRGGVGLIMANQNFDDLKTNDTDLRSLLWNCTQYKQIFSSSDPNSQEYITRASGTKGDWIRASSGSSDLRWMEEAYIKQNDLNEMGCDPFRSLVFISRAEGETQPDGKPFFLKMDYPLTGEVYKKRLKESFWPLCENWPGTFAAAKRPYRSLRGEKPTPRPKAEKAEETAASTVTNDIQARLKDFVNKVQPKRGRKNSSKPEEDGNDRHAGSAS